MIRAMLIIGGAALIVGLTLYTLLDAVRTPAHEARTLPKWLWVLVTLLFPVVGPLMWLILGRPKAQPAAGAPRPGFGQRRSTPAPSVSSPDDDEEYLRWLKAKAERERRSREAESNNKQDSDHKDPEDGTSNQGNGQN
ncbi:MAG: PLDc N-terminal domain-containing protein [Rothia mucilaginosa]|uniref:PLD nuclease N-terminal domain-containing protein n=1 Tax=Rothia mucilaginosa TaxID=43675 RepID=UPI001CB67714|nr:PLD nuclease N-terminal domain-containing protein [Rothia mucilaginosa]MBF1652403.1 PLDc N-terminal domain-containing protein [Rothia mucilaginosa]